MRRLIYISESINSLDTNGLLALCSEFARRNERVEISGLLILIGNQFMQVLEGPEDAVESLALRIAQDPRHRGFTIVFEGAVDKRAFAGWSMRGLDLGRSFPVDHKTRHAIRSCIDEILAGSRRDGEQVIEMIRQITHHLRASPTRPGI